MMSLFYPLTMAGTQEVQSPNFSLLIDNTQAKA
jgi:hypothetical protein